MSEADIQSRWLGRMQTEIGVLSTNLMLVEIQRDALAAKVAADAELIEALKARAQAAEDASRELKVRLRPEVKARKTRGAHPVQPA